MEWWVGKGGGYNRAGLWQVSGRKRGRVLRPRAKYHGVGV